MANIKISELTELTVPADDDEIAIVDKNVVTTKKITRGNFYSDATSSAKGLATATQITKIDGIETGATADQTGAEIKAAYELEASAYTDTKDTKLAGIEAAADVTDEANVTAALPVVDGTSLIKGSVDSTKQARFEVDGLTTSTTRALTIQDKDITIADNADVVLRVEKATFDANTILKADSDNTPAALTVGEQTLLGRITAGAITALTPTQIRTLVNVADGADVTGDNAPQAHEHVSTEITVSSINTPTYNDIQDWINNTQSAGRMSGGATTAHTDSITGVTVGGIGSGEFKVAGDQTSCYIAAEPILVDESTNNDGYYTIASGVVYSGGVTTIPVEEAVGAVADGIIYNGTVDVSDGTGFIKQTDSDIGETVSFDIHADTNITLTDVTTNYLYVDYNSGVPDIKVTTERDSIEHNKQFSLSMVYRNGARVWACSCGAYLPNFLIGNHERLLIARGYERGSGGEISEYGTRNIQSTSGVFFRGSTKVDTTAKTSVDDKITTVYYDGSNWVWTENETQVDNTYYNNIATGLVELGVSKYAVYWICIDYLSNLYVVYGRGSYSLAEAQLAGVPSLMPVVANEFGIVAAKVIIQKATASFAELISAYTQLIPTATPAVHNNLSGLNNGDYKHLTEAAHAIATQAATNAIDGYATSSHIQAIEDNTAKTTNATHTGEVTGSGSLSIDKTAIGNQSIVTALGSDYVLIGDTSDAGEIKRSLISDFASAGGDMAASTYDPATIAEQLVGLTAIQTLTNKTLTQPTITLKQSATPSPTAEGDIQWDTDGNNFVVGDGAGTKIFSDDAVVEARANHTGSQAASTISDFDTEVTNNSAVTANTAKVTNATHTGDVTGSTDLTIAVDAVDIPMLSASGTADGTTYLRGDNTWTTPAGSGDVSKVGTPVDNQVGVWTGDGTIEGTSGLTYSGTVLDLTGDITLSGTVDGIDIATDVAANTAKATNATHTGEVTGSGALTIANDAVTYAKMQNVSATDKVLGRVTAGAGDVEEIACTVFARSILDDADEATFKATVNLEIGTDVLAEQTIGIANDNLVEIDQADAASGEITRLTANGLESRSNAEVKAQLGYITDLSDDASPTLGGTLEINEKAILIDAALSTDHTWTGPTQTITAGENLAIFETAYLKSDGKYWKIDADAEATAKGKIVMATAAISADATGIVLLPGEISFIRDDSTTEWMVTAAGDVMYLSTTAGDLTNDISGYTTGDIGRVAGYMETATTLNFCVDKTWIKIA